MSEPYLGMMDPEIGDLEKALAIARMRNFEKVVLPICHSGLPYEFDNPLIEEQLTDNSYPDHLLAGDTRKYRTMLLLSDNIDCDSADPFVRRQSERIFLYEISLAEHLVGNFNIMIRLKPGNNSNLARLCASRKPFYKLFVLVPAYKPIKIHELCRRDFSEEEANAKLAEYDGWTWWNNFRCTCAHRQDVRAVIELQKPAPPTKTELFRWFSEPLEAVIVPASLFIINKEGKASLDTVWYEVIRYIIRAHISIIVSGNTGENWKDFSSYILEMREYLKNCIELGDNYQLRETLTHTFNPIGVRLNLSQFIGFEADSMKYIAYRNAMIDVLNNLSSNKIHVIMIVNAGRGALVKEALVASSKTIRRTRILAFEKESSAALSLQKAVCKYWTNANICVINKDPRDYTPTEKADIIVWEMFGIYGDAELSPEFLDCADKLLKPNGVSIPRKIMVRISPVMSPILNHLVNTVSYWGTEYSTQYNKFYTHYESCFITVLGSAFYLDRDQELYEFSYPNRSPKKDHTFYRTVTFKATIDGELNGISGHYEVRLSNNVILSNCRINKTFGANTWYPMYFPFAYPIQVKKGEEIEVHIWRCADDHKVWYEWCCKLPHKTRIFNQSGRCHPQYLRQE